MKFISAIILTALLGYAAPLFLTWWSFAITSFIVAIVIHQKSGKAFTAGFAAMFFLWGIQALIYDTANHHLLSEKIASILKLGDSSFVLLLITAFIGGLISGMAALTGSFTRKYKALD